jgi:diguanylate cyclase (GGDEF)-like protein
MLLEEASLNPSISISESDQLLVQARELRSNSPEAALEKALLAVACARNSNQLQSLADSLYLCAELMFDLSNYQAACTQAKEALELYQFLQNPSGIIDTHDTLGKSYEKRGLNTEALMHHQQGFHLSQLYQDQTRTGKSLLSLGILHYNQSDYPGAINHYLQALDISQTHHDHDWQGRILGCLGNAFERMGDYAKALEYHQQCLHHFSQEPYLRERSFALNNIGNVYIALEDYPQAIPFHEQSLAIKRHNKDLWGEGSSLQNLGTCYLLLGDLIQAERYFQESLPIVEKIDDREGISIALQGLGDVATRHGHLDKALDFYLSSFKISNDLGDRYNQVQTLLNLGRVYKQQAQLEEAHRVLDHALQITEDIHTKRLAQHIHNELVSLHEHAGKLSEALKHLKAAYSLERDVFSEDLEVKLKNLKLHFELEHTVQEKELYRLKHIELASAYEELQQANQKLAKTNAQKETLLKTLEKQKRQLERQSTHDALTGLYNRRYFDKELAKAFRDSKRYRRALSVVICDIDNFKKINDRFSHQTGDKVLKTIGRLFKKHRRNTDIVARYGGEEFALLLTGTPGKDAVNVCEKIRHLIEIYPWQNIHSELRVTLSIGISDDMRPDTYEMVMAQADNRLYQAKHNGKNQVVL